MTPEVTLETERLQLRPLRLGDLDALAELHAEPSFWHYPLRRGQSRAESERFLAGVLEERAQRGFGLATVVERASGSLAGWAGLSVPSALPDILPAVEVGWRLGAAWRGLGYATEAGAAWVRWGFEELGLDRILSIFEPANGASGRVMEKLGFETERVLLHPARGLEVEVRALPAQRWRRLCASRSWPLP